MLGDAAGAEGAGSYASGCGERRCDGRGTGRELRDWRPLMRRERDACGPAAPELERPGRRHRLGIETWRGRQRQKMRVRAVIDVRGVNRSLERKALVTLAASISARKLRCAHDRNLP